MGYTFPKDVTAYVGGTVMYDKRFAYHFKFRNVAPKNPSIEQQISYTANRIRAYVSYTFLPPQEYSYVPLSTIRLGLAFSIVKK